MREKNIESILEKDCKVTKCGEREGVWILSECTVSIKGGSWRCRNAHMPELPKIAVHNLHPFQKFGGIPCKRLYLFHPLVRVLYQCKWDVFAHFYKTVYNDYMTNVSIPLPCLWVQCLLFISDCLVHLLWQCKPMIPMPINPIELMCGSTFLTIKCICGTDQSGIKFQTFNDWVFSHVLSIFFVLGVTASLDLGSTSSSEIKRQIGMLIYIITYLMLAIAVLLLQ
jgi:hypothetical protein